MIDKNLYFTLSSSCKLVNGASRNLIVDYTRRKLYFIKNDYYYLLREMDRRQLREVMEDIDDESMGFFREFLQFIEEKEIGFFVQDPERFPKISEAPADDEYISLLDVIVEIDEAFYNRKSFENLCEELIGTGCKDYQIRFLSDFNLDLLTHTVTNLTRANANYIEIHCSYTPELDVQVLKDFVIRQTFVSEIYVYGSPQVSSIEVRSENSIRHHPIILGKITFIDYPFDDGNCCGIINMYSLDYSSFYLHNRLKVRNGCLDRKLTIDKYGNIKNCPSMKRVFGNIETRAIKDVIREDAFKKLWFITKDQISICKVCEFRYNCTDCRAFTQDPDDPYSKPFKCSYNPYTATWEEIAVANTNNVVTV